MAMKQEVNVPLIATIGAISVILLVVIVIGATAWYMRTNQEIAAQNFEMYPDQAVLTVQDTQKSLLTAPAHWVDGAHTTAAIPIDQAMQLVVSTHGQVQMAAPPTAPTTAPAEQPGSR